MKPIGRSQGKGIFLFTKLSQVSDWKTDGRWRPSENPQAESYVVQKYISSPLLVGGKKVRVCAAMPPARPPCPDRRPRFGVGRAAPQFDLRIYALVTNFAPLTVYLYRAGFARFTNACVGARGSATVHSRSLPHSHDRPLFPAAHDSRYDLSNSDLFVHLTNVAIQKTSSEYDRGVRSCPPLLAWTGSAHAMRTFFASAADRRQVADPGHEAVPRVAVRSAAQQRRDASDAWHSLCVFPGTGRSAWRRRS